MDYGRFLVISIGTGSPKTEEKYSAKMATKWGTLRWLLHGGSVPLVDVFTQASADMVDFHISVVFQALQSEQNYLRIQGLARKDQGKYSADAAAKWGVLGWLTSGGSTPLVDVFTQASADMVDLHISAVFQALHSDKYLRIQEDTLSGEVSSVDIATKKNLKDLVKVGEGLLKKLLPG
ncbi:hypothetical protein LWI29_005135 [Acer saccharum]|uniref:Patatin n=1 Tax=Acer saccharum TaxID=4024 RepID=A0AA39VDG2_ACESA|nr:hypothetical protein LWI29_005135 [Acer saccharum]